MNQFRLIVGTLIWGAVAFFVWRAANISWGRPNAPQEPVGEILWEYLAAPRANVQLELKQPMRLAVGDPIFATDPRETLKQIGEITEVIDPATGKRTPEAIVATAKAMFYPAAGQPGPHAVLGYFEASDSMAWVFETLMPPAKREKIALELTVAFSKHQDEIMAALRPAVEETLRDALISIEEDLPAAIARHKEEWEQLGRKFQQEIVDTDIVPLARDVLWPIVRDRSQETANKVGKEIWERASLWRFGWRFLYDTSPLPEQGLVEKEWQRFLTEEAMPVLLTHSDELINVFGQVMKDSLANNQVQNVLKISTNRIALDPDVQRVLWSVIREVTVENPHFRKVLADRWADPKFQQALRLAADRMEPAIRNVGEILLGSQAKGISPEFARVLRHQVLGKDQRWLVLYDVEATTSTSPPRQASETMKLLVVEGVPEGPAHPKNSADGSRDSTRPPAANQPNENAAVPKMADDKSKQSEAVTKP
ncbi:MAG: hypothetical protein U1D30_24910 [Planctomycetota bacterium]